MILLLLRFQEAELISGSKALYHKVYLNFLGLLDFKFMNDILLVIFRLTFFNSILSNSLMFLEKSNGNNVVHCVYLESLLSLVIENDGLLLPCSHSVQVSAFWRGLADGF